VVEVELDPAVLELARTDPRMVRANEGSLDDPRSSWWSTTRCPGCGPPTRSSTRSSSTCPTPTRRRPPSSTPRSSTAWPPARWPRRPDGGAVRLAVLRARGVLVHRGDRRGHRAAHVGLPRRRAQLRRLGLRARRPGAAPVPSVDRPWPAS
jgi:hypothetical protein